MEMPIRIIITLFVAVVVALGVITFSQKMISDSKTKMYNFNDDELAEDRILEMTTVTSNQVATLAEACYKENSGKELEDKICFVVLGDVQARSSEVLDKIKDVNIENYLVNINNAKNAVKVKYNPLDDQVIVSG